MTKLTVLGKKSVSVVALGLIVCTCSPAIAAPVPAAPPQAASTPLKNQTLHVEVLWLDGGASIGKKVATVSILTPDGKVVASGKTKNAKYQATVPTNVFYTVNCSVEGYKGTSGIRVTDFAGTPGSTVGTACQLQKNAH